MAIGIKQIPKDLQMNGLRRNEAAIKYFCRHHNFYRKLYIYIISLLWDLGHHSL